MDYGVDEGVTQILCRPFVCLLRGAVMGLSPHCEYVFLITVASTGPYECAGSMKSAPWPSHERRTGRGENFMPSTEGSATCDR